jgi:hypothetical protein
VKPFLMRSDVISRIIATLVLGLSIGSYVYHDYWRWNRLGRAAFSLHEMERFDRFMAGPRPAVTTVLGGMLAAIAVVVVYELLVYTFSAVLGAVSAHHESSEKQ